MTITLDPGVLPAFDPRVTLDRLEGDAELLTAIFDVYRAERPRMIGAMRSAVDAGDAGAVKRSAHDFKGAVGNFADTTTFDFDQQLELMGCDGVLTGAAHTLTLLESAAERFEQSLSDFLVALPAAT